MTISIGDQLPEGQFQTMTEAGVKPIHVDEIFKGKRVALFGVPAVFTPGCSKIHLASYVSAHSAIIANGFDIVACLAVSDAWVMAAWSNTFEANGKVLMLADGNAEFVTRLGLESDLSQFGMGMRCKRFSMTVVDGRVESLNIDEGKIQQTHAVYTCALDKDA